jgi:hypothetical protein
METPSASIVILLMLSLSIHINVVFSFNISTHIQLYNQALVENYVQKNHIGCGSFD